MTPKSKVFLEDCMQGMKRYPDGFWDLALCDIPYGLNVARMAFTKETDTTVKQKNGSRMKIKREPYLQKDWDTATPPLAYFDELRRVTKNQIIFGIEYVNWTGVGEGRIKWKKGLPESVSFKPYEMAYCSMIDYEFELPLLWAGMQQAKSLSEPMTQQGNKRLNEKRVHPCHKPVLLYKAIIKHFGAGCRSILDTHLGGGSSRIAAYDAGIDFTGFEVDADYYRIQEHRFKQHTAQASLFHPSILTA